MLHATLDDVISSNEVSLMGDFNMDYLCEGSPTHKKLKLLEKTHQLTQIISLPTRVSRKSAITPDHINSNSIHIANSGTLNINTSDHYPCFIIRKKQRFLIL